MRWLLKFSGRVIFPNLVDCFRFKTSCLRVILLRLDERIDLKDDLSSGLHQHSETFNYVAESVTHFNLVNVRNAELDAYLADQGVDVRTFFNVYD